MKRFTALLTILLALVISFSLAACGKKDQDNKDETKEGINAELIGTWESQESAGTYYTFNEDGTGSLSGDGYSLSFSFTDKDGVIAITYTGSTTAQNEKYTIKDDILTLENELLDGAITYKKTEKKPTEATENNTDNGSKLVGSWESADNGSVYTFKANGAGTLTLQAATVEFTYTDDGSKLELTFANTAPKKAAYTLEGDTLTITDEDHVTQTLTKKKS